jgi:Skp family chaperone for outer membrane proteins
MWIRRHWRAILARLPLPTLALAAAWGVGSFASLFVPPLIAVIQAAAFELTYIGLAIIDVPERDRRKRATKISISAVAVSVVYNSAAGYFHRNPAALVGLSFAEELGLAIAHGAPLAIVAFLVADLLFHTRAPSRRAAQLRALVRKLTRLLRTARSELLSLQGELAQWKQRAANDEQAATSYRAQLDRAMSESAAALRAKDHEIARLQEGGAQPLAIDGIDLLAVARRLRTADVSLRETADLLRIPESTLRSRLKATNGQHAG